MTTYIVIHALNSVFHERPEAFDGLRMNIASNVYFLAVPNAPMVVVMRGSGESVIDRIIIR